MNETFIGIVGYVLALAGISAGIIFWLRQQNFVRVHEKLLKKWDEKEAEEKKLRKTVQALESANREFEILALKWEREQREAHRQWEELRATLTLVQSDFEKKERALSLQRDHLQEQADALMVQVKEIDREKAELKAKSDMALRELKATSDETIRTLSRESERIRKLLGNTQEERDKLARQSGEERAKDHGKEEELHRLRKKLAHYNHFFKVMRGQKEMLEERLENWERALQMLSAWAVKEKGGDSSWKTLGELVAAALQVTMQGQLVDDAAEREELNG